MPPLEFMIQRLESLKEFSELVQKEYPSVGLRSLPFKSVQSEVILANSNGLRLYQEDSYYDYFVMFSAQDGNRTGSLNYIGNKTKSIPKNFMDPVGLRDLLKGSALELDAVALNEEIKGDVILTPYVMPDFLGFILSQLSTSSLISKSSLFEGRKGEKILSGQFTLKSEPFGQKFATQVPFSGEGVKYEAGHIIKNGVLNHYLLDVYGANRLKDEVNKTPTSNLSLEAGSDSLSDMIKGVKRGLMLTRFSGGSPSPNGDFSGVAKNSFLIENGEVTKSLKEVMISGNIIDMLSKIEGVSKEVINDGSHEFPWVKTSMSN
jgi:PmbA protein